MRRSQHKTPLKRTAIHQVSRKQARRERDLQVKKKALISAQVDERGWAFCDECGTSYPPEDAIFKMDLAHRVKRSHEPPEVADRLENLKLLCRGFNGERCHPLEHNQ